MNALQQWDCCPEFIDIGDANGAIRLLKCDDLYAVRGTVSKHKLKDVKVRLTGDGISILRGTPSSQLSSDVELLPVYAVSKDSTPAVVTERIFLRLEEETTVESIRNDIEALDFHIDDIPAYAPHCAWLEPASGRVDEALSKLEMLRALPRVAHAEPQLLRARGWKGDT